jgi:hypothetical protein
MQGCFPIISRYSLYLECEALNLGHVRHTKQINYFSQQFVEFLQIIQQCLANRVGWHLKAQWLLRVPPVLT